MRTRTVWKKVQKDKEGSNLMSCSRKRNSTLDTSTSGHCRWPEAAIIGYRWSYAGVNSGPAQFEETVGPKVKRERRTLAGPLPDIPASLYPCAGARTGI